MGKYLKYIVILFIVSIMIGLCISYVKRNGKVDISAQNITGNVTEVGSEEFAKEASSSEEKITPNTIFKVETKYEDCKHTETSEYEAPREVINFTLEELEEKYPEYIVINFSKDEVDLYNVAEGLCNKHYKITIDESGMIIVYRLKSNYDTEIYQTTEISSEYLSTDDKKELEEGIYIYGTAELNSILENFE